LTVYVYSVSFTLSRLINDLCPIMSFYINVKSFPNKQNFIFLHRKVWLVVLRFCCSLTLSGQKPRIICYITWHPCCNG